MNTPDALRRNIEAFEKAVGYRYLDRNNAFAALVHSSWANENPQSGLPSNERLEFMGDALLDFVFTECLYRGKPDCSEGEMSRLRSLIVCEASLSKAAESIGLGAWLLMGKGEDLGGGRSRPSILADAMEAVFGSISLDGGLEPAAETIRRLLASQYHAALSGKADADWKTRLQELLQQKGSVSIAYRVIGSTGPDHARVFEVEVTCDGATLGTGTGRSKKEAEQAAARNALERYGTDHGQTGGREEP